MKTLQEIKEELAKEEGYKDWEDLFGQCDSHSLYWTEVAERYASQPPIELTEEEQEIVSKISFPITKEWYLRKDNGLTLKEDMILINVSIKTLNATLKK